MEIANLSDAEFKTLAIRMLRELLEHGKKIKEEMKVMLSEIKNNPQETNREGKEAGTKPMIWNIRKRQTFNQNRRNKNSKK